MNKVSRTLYTRLDQSLSWPGKLRKTDRRAEAEIDLQRITIESFANVPEESIKAEYVAITLHRAQPKPDGKYRPSLPWALASACHPIYRGLDDLGLLGMGDLITRIRPCDYEDECIIVELYQE